MFLQAMLTWDLSMAIARRTIAFLIFFFFAFAIPLIPFMQTFLISILERFTPFNAYYIQK